MSDDTLDLSELHAIWDAQRAAIGDALARIDYRGTRRPARDPDERAWLDAHGGSVFIEDEDARAAANAYYARKYQRPENK